MTKRSRRLLEERGGREPSEESMKLPGFKERRRQSRLDAAEVLGW